MSYRASRWLFLRLVGLAFLAAFVSLQVQLPGLLGSRGILPAAEVAELLARADRSWLEVPTLLRGELTDGRLQAFCGAGIAASLALVLGIAPPLALAVCWLLYLSFTLSGRSFFSYQWDALLLETGLAALVAAPWCLLDRPCDARPLSPLRRLALRALLFKLMFLSGWVKLGDAEWDGLTALSYHWWTQPLPTSVAWHAARLPEFAQQGAAAATLGIELGLPFLVLWPRPGRLVAAAGFASLMVLIGLTGNYNFFNLLTLALCATLVDDGALARLLPSGLADAVRGTAARPALPLALRLPGELAALALVVLSADVVAERTGLGPSRRGPDAARWSAALRAPLDPFYVSSAYGLFADMTTERFEIELEASRDGARWEPYVFRWKPGPLDRRPAFCEPHQPRLDWEMWFAALPDRSGARPIPWSARDVFPRLCQRLLEAEPAVLALLERAPLGSERPRYLRATASPYRFTTPAEREATGAWWKRGASVPFAPVLTLVDGRLALAR